MPPFLAAVPAWYQLHTYVLLIYLNVVVYYTLTCANIYEWPSISYALFTIYRTIIMKKGLSALVRGSVLRRKKSYKYGLRATIRAYWWTCHALGAFARTIHLSRVVPPWC